MITNSTSFFKKSQLLLELGFEPGLTESEAWEAIAELVLNSSDAAFLCIQPHDLANMNFISYEAIPSMIAQLKQFMPEENMMSGAVWWTSALPEEVLAANEARAVACLLLAEITSITEENTDAQD